MKGSSAKSAALVGAALGVTALVAVAVRAAGHGSLARDSPGVAMTCKPRLFTCPCRRETGRLRAATPISMESLSQGFVEENSPMQQDALKC
jgi:hypothetical protein